MSKLLVADVPVSGKFIVRRVSDGAILHRFDGKEPGDIMPDVAIREVLNMSVENGYLVMEVR